MLTRADPVVTAPGTDSISLNYLRVDLIARLSPYAELCIHHQTAGVGNRQGWMTAAQ